MSQSRWQRSDGEHWGNDDNDEGRGRQQLRSKRFGARARHVWIVSFLTGEDDSMFFLLFVVASVFIYLFRHHQTNHRVGPINRVKQKRREKRRDFFSMPRHRYVCFFLLFFVLALTRDSREIWPSGGLRRVEGYFSFYFFFLHKENTRMENRSCSAHTVYIL